SANTLVLVFGASNFLDATQPVDELIRHYPQSQVMGCSTAGEIFGTQVQDDSLSVAVMQFERTRVAAASTHVSSVKDSYQAGELIASQLKAPDLVAVFVLSNGTTINGSELVRALNDQFGG